MATRLRITLEFNPAKESDLDLYNALMNYSSPPAYIKDVLRGLLPIPGEVKVIENNNLVDISEDQEEIMDF